jgi:hypothetical protein
MKPLRLVSGVCGGVLVLLAVLGLRVLGGSAVAPVIPAARTTGLEIPAARSWSHDVSTMERVLNGLYLL